MDNTDSKVITFLAELRGGLDEKGQAILDNSEIREHTIGAVKELDSIVKNINKKNVLPIEKFQSIAKSYAERDYNGLKKMVDGLKPEARETLEPYFSAVLEMKEGIDKRVIGVLKQLEKSKHITPNQLEKGTRLIEASIAEHHKGIAKFSGIKEAKPSQQQTKQNQTKDTTKGAKKNSGSEKPESKPHKAKPKARTHASGKAEKAVESWVTKLGKNHGGKLAVGGVLAAGAVAYVMSRDKEEKAPDLPAR